MVERCVGHCVVDELSDEAGSARGAAGPLSALKEQG